MSTQALAKTKEKFLAPFDDFFNPWNEWFDQGVLWNRTINVPAVNITEEPNEFRVSLAVPGLTKEDFKIDVEGNMMIISSEQEESKEDKDKRFTRKEYNYSSFRRSFTLPNEVDQEKIAAKYENGVLKISLPRREDAKKTSVKHVPVK